MTANLKEIEKLITKYENYADKLDREYENKTASALETPKTAKEDLVAEVLNDLYLLKERSEKIKGCPKVLESSPETKVYLDKLKKVYLIGCWAHYGVREHYFSGKYADRDKTRPLVYDYDDHNGTCDNWYLKEIDSTTTGYVWGWTFNKDDAERIANSLEEKRKVNF